MANAMQSTGSKIFVYVLIGLLILGLAGFGIGSFSSSAQSVGSVGDQEITIDDYLQSLQNEINSFARLTGQSLQPSQAIAYGLNQRALEGLVFQATIDNAATEIGLSVGDETVLRQLTQTRQFQDINGNFSSEAYDFALERSGLTATEFDNNVRKQQARSLLATTVQDGVATPDEFVGRLISHFLTEREATWAQIDINSLTEAMPEPGEEDLQKYYSDNPEEFTRPETRSITYAWITAALAADTDAVAEADIRALYEERSGQFNIPERRDVDRLVFSDLIAAEDAKRRLDAGEISFDEAVAERGINLADIALGPVAYSGLSAASADAVFGVEEIEIVGPVESSLGPALFRINAVLAAQSTSFEEARARLASELAEEEARSVIDNARSGLEDLLADGADIEQLAAESIMELGTVEFNDDHVVGIAAFNAFREAAARANEGDFPELLELPNGGVFAIRLDDIKPPEVKPFAEVRDSVEEAWKRQIEGEMAEGAAKTAAAELMNGKSFEELALTPVSAPELRRGGVSAGAPEGLADAVFEHSVKEAAAFGSGSDWGVVFIQSEASPDPNSDEVEETASGIRDQFSNSAGGDLFSLFGDFMQREYVLFLDQSIINAVHAQLP